MAMSSLYSGSSSPRKSSTFTTDGGDINGTAASSFFAPPSSDLDDLHEAAKRVVDGSDPNQNIHDFIRGVRLDEIVTLSQSPKALHKTQSDSSFPASFYVPVIQYAKYLYGTWGNVVTLTIQNEIPFTDWILTVLISILTSVILFFAMIWCQFATNPFIYGLYFDWADQNAHGLGLVNAADPKLFNSLTPDQTKAAKDKLSQSFEDSVNTEDLRVFDLDIAKLLLQLSSIVYERAPIAVHQTLEAITSARRLAPPRRLHISAASDAARRNTIHRPANPSPHSPAHAPSPNASISHTPGGIHTIPDAVSKPGNLVSDIWDQEQADKIRRAFELSNNTPVIEAFCDRLEIDYEPVSELNNSGSAYCSFFWDNNSNWIVVTFKGTGIVEYADLVTDLTTRLEDVSDFLPGYSKAITGFKERLYPSQVDPLGGTRPWESIILSLGQLSQQLAYARAQEGYNGKINVWFTGHSLGCALATLAYARAISVPSDLAKYPIELRDAYLFAAPVSADRATAVKFNERLAKLDKTGEGTGTKREHSRTMWRIRNAGDAVATLLPQLGDRADLVGKLSPTSPIGFAHLGAEIHMLDSPKASKVISPTSHFGGSPSDYDASPPIRVEVRSEFTKGAIEAQRKLKFKERPGEEAREKFFVWAENIPLIGRLFAHDTVCYWDQLDRIALSSCQWATE